MKTIQLFACGFLALRLTNCQTESVDVAILAGKQAIFVAERAQQKLLIFEMPMDSGNYMPIYSTTVSGASSVSIDF